MIWPLRRRCAGSFRTDVHPETPDKALLVTRWKGINGALFLWLLLLVSAGAVELAPAQDTASGQPLTQKDGTGTTAPSPAAAASKEKKTPLRRSYNFQDQDIRQALSALAQDQDINMIMSPEVTGKITVSLYQLTIEEAIRAITMAGGFSYRKQDDTFHVYKPKEVRDPQSETGIIKTPPVRSLNGQTMVIYNFQDYDIRQVLSTMAKEQNINVIIAPEVTGKITVHLNNLTLDDALRAIVMAGGSTFQKHDDLYYVYKPKTVPDPQAGRLEVRVFQLKFSAIDKVQEILTAIPGIRTVRIHELSKTIIIEDTPENIAKIEKIIRGWDVAPRQVLIEARIMQVNLTDDMSMGVDWQKVFGDLTLGTTGFVSGGPGLTANLLTAAGSRNQFTAALEALQTKTQVNTLSTPKILALHGKPSRVQVGGRQGYKTNTFTPTGTTENISFLDTGTILDITPFIDDQGHILLDVKPQINSVTFDTAGTPNQQTTTVSTSLVAKNGQTIFIGGLIEDTKTGTRNMVPCLGSLPGLGLLFGQLREGIGKKELIVLITPQIIDLGTRSAEALEKTKILEDTLKNEPQPLMERLLQDFP